jgi:hypothetical protein
VPPSGAASWFTRERILFGSVILLVLIGAAVLTTLLVRPDAPAPNLEPATVSIGSTVGQGKVIVRSFPSGAKVKVAGAWLPEGTPTQTTLAAGRPARIQVKLGDDYEIYETEITPEVGRETLVDAQLVKIRGTLTVESRPADATVFIEGRESGHTPCTVTDLPVDRPMSVRIQREGFQPSEQRIEWNGRREQTVEVRLEPLSAEPPRVVAALDPPPVAARRPEPRYTPRYEAPAPRRTPTPARAPDPPPRRPSSDSGGGGGGGKGFVTVNARPWGTVYINGAMVASETPLMRYPLPAGSHTVQVYFKGDRGDKSPVKRIVVERSEETKVTFTP